MSKHTILHETETLDRLYLELSAITGAKSKNDLKLERLVWVIKKIRKSDCGAWLKPQNGSKRLELMKLMDELYNEAGVK